MGSWLLPFLAASVSWANPTAPVEAVWVAQQADGLCAATHLGEGWFLTAQHCVAGAGPVRLISRAGERIRGRRVSWSAAEDLAWIRAEPVDAVQLELGQQPVEQGATVQVVGHPFGSPRPLGYFAGTLRWSRRPATVAASGDVALQLDTTLYPGDSGGPVVDGDGRVVGVVSRKINGGPGFATHAVRAQRLKDAPQTPLSGSVRMDLIGTLPVRSAESWTLGLHVAVAFWNRWTLHVEATPAGGAGDAVLGAVRTGASVPVGTGPWTLWIEPSGGAALVRRQGARAGAVVGGALRWGPIRVGADAVLATDVQPRVTLGLTWPGQLTTF